MEEGFRPLPYGFQKPITMAIIALNGYAGSGKDLVGRIVQWLTARKKYEMFTPKSLEEFLKEYENADEVVLFYEQGIGDICSPFQIKKWAGKLKIIASILTGIHIKNFEDQDFKHTRLPSCWSKWKYNGKVTGTDVLPVYGNDPELVNMTVREFLQKLGTEALRNGLHENTWVNALMADYHTEERVYQLDDMVKRVYPPSKWVITDTRFPNEAGAVKGRGGVIVRINRPGVTAVNDHPSDTSLDDWNFDYVIENDGSMQDLVSQVDEILIKEKLYI